MKKIKLVSGVLPFIVMNFFYSSCEKTYKAEVPSYLSIEKIDLTTNAASQGSSSNKISDAWVYVNDELVGVYELPAKFPVIKNGVHNLKIKAGIKDNGISASRIEYPFYAPYTNSSFNLIADSVIEVKPIVSYVSDVNFTWMEDFEDPAIGLDSIYPSTVKIKNTNDVSLAFEGKYSGHIILEGSNNIYKAKSNNAFVLPTAGRDVYLELNYKSTASLYVSVISNNPGSFDEEVALRIAPTNRQGTAEWNKIYVNLTPQVSANSNANDYYIVFYANLNNDGLTSGEIFLDNIKLLHF